MTSQFVSENTRFILYDPSVRHKIRPESRNHELSQQDMPEINSQIWPSPIIVRFSIDKQQSDK